MRVRRLTGLALFVGATSLAWPDAASAHAFDIGREDVSLPVWVFAAAASVVLIASFAALSVAWRVSKLESEHWRPLPDALSRALINSVTEALAGAAGVFLLGVVVWSGLSGVDVPSLNFSETFVFITVWLGGVLVSVLFGNVYRAFNPWRAIARVAARVFELVARRPAKAPLSYPEWLGRWPAAVGIVVFVWLELIWGVNGVGITPRVTAAATLVYTAYTLAAMALFGIERWAARGETFSVYFGMFAELSALEVKDGRLGVRRPLSGAPGWAEVPGSIALIVATIGTTAFDGAHETVLAHPISWFYGRLLNRGLGTVAAGRLADSVFLAASLALVAAIFWAGVRGMRTVRGSPSVGDLGRAFGHTLIPIGLAYLIAHYFSYIVFGEQGQFTFLISDPLGRATSGPITYVYLSSTLIWYVQVGALVVGHVIALALGHDRAIAVYGPRRASLSQRWMLVVMVAFTSLGLFLLSQPVA